VRGEVVYRPLPESERPDRDCALEHQHVEWVEDPDMNPNRATCIFCGLSLYPILEPTAIHYGFMPGPGILLLCDCYRSEEPRLWFLSEDNRFFYSK
jgi:hypothetical protein